MDGCGLTTGSTVIDALLIALIPVLTVLLQRAGLGWLLDRQPKPGTPEPTPPQPQQAHPAAMVSVPLPGQTVAAPGWLLLLWPILEQLIRQALDLLSKRLGREPTPEEQAAEIKRVSDQFRRGRLRIYPVVEMNGLSDGDLEQVTGGKNRLARTLDGIDAAVADIGRAARSGDESFRNLNGLFRQPTRR